ncbi:MAG TPA: hypothetical protein VNW25_00040 [Candidatus Sulfotelmatobacter sp.]|jgi:hypothetical protein|nr:hypothetical protein [Candidatus Sulfotelmatobacter sp.]
MVQRLETQPKDVHHFLSVTPPVLSTDVKLARSQLRLYKKQIKNAKEERWLALGREIAVTIPQNLIRETGSVLSSVATAHGEMFRGWFSNVDPLTWAGDAAAVTVYFLLVANVLRKTGKLLGIDDLASDIGLTDFITNLPANVTATVSKDLGRDDGTGTFGVAKLDGKQLYIQSEFRWYTSQTTRDVSLALLRSGIDTSFVAVSRTFNPDGSVTILPRPPGEDTTIVLPPPGNPPPRSTQTDAYGNQVSPWIGPWSSQSQALAQAPVNPNYTTLTTEYPSGSSRWYYITYLSSK